MGEQGIGPWTSVLSGQRSTTEPLARLRSGRDLHPRVAVLQTAVLATSPPDRQNLFYQILSKNPAKGEVIFFDLLKAVGIVWSLFSRCNIGSVNLLERR